MQLNWHILHWNDISKVDFYSCAHLRVKVFVVEQNCPYQEFDYKDQKSYHVFAKDMSGKVMAYLRIVDKGISYEEFSIGRVVVDTSVRKLNLGDEIMKRAIRFVNKELNGDKIRISAQTYLQNWYEKLGFEVRGSEYLEDDIPHVEMLLEIK